jgi:FkbM family methyltransferase
MTLNLGRSRVFRASIARLKRRLEAYVDGVATQSARREIAVEGEMRLTTPRRWGPDGRVAIAASAVVNDALFNTISGSISVGHHAFFGHEVALLTGTHDASRIGLERQLAMPSDGHDIIIGPGVWIASRAVILGPCRIGANAVIAAGSLVNADVPPDAVVTGVPARLVGWVGEPSPGPSSVQVMTDVGTLSAHLHDQVITPYLREHGTWEEDDRRLLEAELAPGAVALDVGANIGYMTVAAARAVGRDGMVFAVEPHPDNLALLHANLIRNGVADRVRVIAAAAWDTPGIVDLAESSENTGDHRVQTLQRERTVLKVRALRLDEILPDGKRVAVIKLDTQASEHRVLQGASALLSKDRPVILCEFWPQGLRERGEDPLAILASFRRLGYDVELPHDPGLTALPDAAVTETIHGRSTSPHGGFTTLRLCPRH